MSEPTLYQEAGPWTPGAIATWVVPVERCEHGNIDPHSVWTLTDDWGWWKPCPGAGIGGDEGS